MKESHLKGKNHLRNIRLIEMGQPPKKKTKLNYYSSYQKIQDIKKANQLMREKPIVFEKLSVEQMFGMKPHEILQAEVEEIYKKYKEIAGNADDAIRAQQVYSIYQKKYDEYIAEYERFAKELAEKKDEVKDDEIDAIVGGINVNKAKPVKEDGQIDDDDQKESA